MELEVGDVVLCTVEKIEKTNVFVKIAGAGKELDGNLVINEIAPGRIRNLRDYVIPKKKIVCKILRIENGRIDLSLRRVSQKETKEVMEEYKKEKSYISVLKSVLGESAEKIIEEIRKEERLFDFLEEVKEDSKQLEKIVGKSSSDKILEIIKTQKQKSVEIKKEVTLKTTEPDGLELIRKILGSIKDAEVKYASGGKYSLKTESQNPKEADKKLEIVIENIKAQTKGKNFEVSIKEK